MLVIMAIVGGLAFQIFINVGMAVGILPVIGVPLPLMSAGLSAILAPSNATRLAISLPLRPIAKRRPRRALLLTLRGFRLSFVVTVLSPEPANRSRRLPRPSGN